MLMKRKGGAQTLIDKTPIFLHSSLEIFLDNYQLVICEPVIARIFFLNK